MLRPLAAALLALAARAAPADTPALLLPASLGRTDVVWVAGRVLEEAHGERGPAVVRNGRVLLGRSLAGAPVHVSFLGRTGHAVSGRHGEFEVALQAAPGTPFPPGEHRAVVVVPGARGEALVRVVPPDAPFLLVSDLDDTVAVTNVTSKRGLLTATFLQDADTQPAVPGMAALYRCLLARPGGPEPSLAFVSGSPVQYAPRVASFLAHNGFPPGALYLRDLGPATLSGYKEPVLARLAERFPQPLVLVGDSGERDPEIYAEFAREHPGRVLAVWIRQATPAPGPPERFLGEGLFADPAEVARDAASRALAEASCVEAEFPTLDALAERYVKLVLAVGRHDPSYVDAYYGPKEWAEASQATIPLEELEARARGLAEELERAQAGPAGSAGVEAEPLIAARRRFLVVQARSVLARVRLLRGLTMRFDDESEALYGARAPAVPAGQLEMLHAKLDRLLPGEGPLEQRIEALRAGFAVPKEKLPVVLKTVLDEARRRTREWIPLPPGELVTLELVTGKTWGAYNWYQGDARSLIQVNADLPIFLSRVVLIGSHEGYPGHHVQGALLEQHLVRERGWIEYTVMPLYSPLALIAEGSASYGVEVAFPDLRDYLRKVVLPLTGLPAARFDLYMDVEALAQQLGYAENEAARGYLDGRLSRDQARDWLARYRLMSPQRAERFMANIEAVRTYVINYTVGRDRIAAYIERNGGTDANPARRWQLFRELISRPTVPSDLY